MTAPAPESEMNAYVAAVVMAYVELPETPLSSSLQDHRQAWRLHDRGIPLRIVESALLLGSLRRLVRPADLPPLPAIRSLAYFQPVIDELLAHPMPENYLDYLRLKLNRIAARSASPVQKNTFPGDSPTGSTSLCPQRGMKTGCGREGRLSIRQFEKKHDTVSDPSKTPDFYPLCLQGIARSAHLQGRPLFLTVDCDGGGVGDSARGCRKTSSPIRCNLRTSRLRVRSGCSRSK